MHEKHVLTKGLRIGDSQKALVMLHGRGANAEDILSLSSYLDVKDFSIIAPQATGNTWYPYSFMAPQEANEPWLGSAIELLSDVVNDIMEEGITAENIYFLGFSQGACLTLEFVARFATLYGGVVAFTGGLIGQQVNVGNYTGDFKGTPIFIGSSNPDPHVPVERVHESVQVLKKMNAVVTEKIYNNMGHTINEDELDTVNQIIFRRS